MTERCTVSKKHACRSYAAVPRIFDIVNAISAINDDETINWRSQQPPDDEEIY